MASAALRPTSRAMPQYRCGECVNCLNTQRKKGCLVLKTGRLVRGSLATCGQCRNCLNPHWKARCLNPLNAVTQQPAAGDNKPASGSKAGRADKAGRGSGRGGRGTRGGRGGGRGRGRRGGRPPADAELEANALTDGEAGQYQQQHPYWAGSPGSEDDDEEGVEYGEEVALQQQGAGSGAAVGDNSLLPTASGRQRFLGDLSLLLFTANFEKVRGAAKRLGWGASRLLQEGRARCGCSFCCSAFWNRQPPAAPPLLPSCRHAASTCPTWSCCCATAPPPATGSAWPRWWRRSWPQM